MADKQQQPFKDVGNQEEQPTPKDTNVDLEALMQEFIAAVQAVDATLSNYPQAQKALEIFKELVQGVK